MAQQFGFDLSPEDISSASAQTHQQVSPQTGGLDELSYVPWWKRKLLQMQSQDVGQGIQQAQGGGGESVVNNWASLGKGVGNLAKKFIGMADGGAVQGPTYILAGEAGEREDIVPEGKAIPYAIQTLMDGIPPNPASLPRVGEHRPPPPVILANTPAMACGGKVIPKMADGGKVYGRPVQNLMEDETDYFGVGDHLPVAPSLPWVEAAQLNAAVPATTKPSPYLPPLPTVSRVATQGYYDTVAQGTPQPKWYERMIGPDRANGPLDMRAGVAPYSMGGRALGNLIRGVLPVNKKRAEYANKLAAAQAAAQMEQMQNADAQKQYELGVKETEARSRIARNEAAQANYERQANQQPATVDPYKDMVEVDEATGRRAGVMPGQDGKYRIPRSSVRIPSTPSPSTPSVQEQNQQIAFKAFAEKRGKKVEELTAAEQQSALAEHAKALKPPKPAGASGGSNTDRDDAKAIADAIMRGDQPPVLTGLYRMGAPVRAALAKNGYDHSTALRDWQAIQRHLSTLNGPQQERLRQAINFTYDSTDIIEDLYNQWRKVGPNSGWKAFNKAGLAAAKQLPGEAGSVASTLEAQINDLTSEMATVYKGGNASTDESLRLAAQNLKADWNEQTFKKALDLIRKNLQIRKNSIYSSTPVGVSPNSPYAPPQTEQKQEAKPNQSAQTIRVKRKSDGKTGSIPAANFDPAKYEKVN